MNAEQEGGQLAATYRARHDLGDIQPLADLIAIVEESEGIDVAVLDVGSEEHGMTARDPQRGAVVIAIARTRNPMRQRSTLAHELGHIVADDQGHLGAHQSWGSREPVEMRADVFARHLLIPAPAVHRVAAQAEADESLLSTLVRLYLVSPAMAAIQMSHVGAISDEQKAQWLALSTPTLAARHGWTDQYRTLQAASATRRAPQRLLARATEGYTEGVVSAHAIARLRGVSEDDVRREFEEAGISARPAEVTWSSSSSLGQQVVDLSDLDDLSAT